MSKARKIIEIVLGILFIFLSIAIFVFLIPDLVPLLKRTPYLLLEPNMRLRNEFGQDWFWQSIGWVIAYFCFRGGRSFLRDAWKPRNTSEGEI